MAVLKKTVAVVGGGITGLVAAWELSKAGIDVVVYEKEPYLGGLASGFPLHGTFLEKTYHHIFSTHDNVIQLAKELGISDRLSWRDSSVGIFYQGRIYPFTSPLDLIRFTPLSLYNRIRQGLVSLYLTSTKNSDYFDRIPAQTWLIKYAGKQAYKIIWRPLLNGKFSKYAKEVPLLWLKSRVYERARSRSKIWQREMLGYMQGSFQTLIDVLESKLRARNVTIKTNSTVYAIRQNDKNGLVRVCLSDSWREFDKIFCTIPSSVFANLIDGTVNATSAYINELKSIRYFGAMCLIFTSKQALSNYYWINVCDLDSPFVVFIQHTNLHEESHYGEEHVYYLARYLAPNDVYYVLDKNEIKKKFFSQLELMFPQFDPKAVNETKIFKFNNAQHLVDCNYSFQDLGHTTPVTNVFLFNFAQLNTADRDVNFAIELGRQARQYV